jgi:hypothetical protein
MIRGIEIVNAQIEEVTLGYDEGYWTFWLRLSWGGCGQGFGGFSLGGDYTDYVIKGILNAVGVTKWEQLKGKYVRVKREEGLGGNILEIGNIIEDKWFDPKGWKGN